MAIDQFTKGRFEQALPVNRTTGDCMWKPLGLRDGEHCYAIPVKDGVVIIVRSSVRADGLAADTAKDSIRCWLASDLAGTPLGSKAERWISRVNGWDKRTTATLRKLYILGLQVGKCPACQSQMGVYKVKNGPNKDRWFSRCRPCDKFGRWVNDETIQ